MARARKVRKKAPAAKQARHQRVRRDGDAQLAFDAIAIEGGLLAPEWLARAAQLEAGGQSDADYRVPKGLNLRDELGRYWRIAQALWNDFASSLDVGSSTENRSLVRAERLVSSLLRECLGFQSLGRVASAEMDEQAHPIRHLALAGRVPVVIAPAGMGLDTLATAFGDGTRRRSAFGLCQEFLNAEEGALWGIATDGAALRILRDNSSLTRPAWIEADLRRIFTEELFSDFAALWLLAHESRFGRPGQPVTDCSLEAWREAGREEGTRAREHLRDGVEQALLALGQGFLTHPENRSLRTALATGALDTAYFHELLRLAYRLIFVLTAEERGVLHSADCSETARGLYADGYSLRRLRERALKRSAHDRHHDHWETVKVVFRGLAEGEPRIGLPALAGIFSEEQCPHLDAARLENRFLLLALFRLSWLREEAGLARVNWRDMGPEELGSVYESLLELVPTLVDGGRSFAFASATEAAHARRSTGSYYTPDKLVQALLDSALQPVIDRTIREHADDPAAGLLALAVVDPACGSGHFLLAAARRLAASVARVQANGTPSAAEFRRALRQVVGRCIYGVDLNPMAVELCKVSLWMEAVEPGLPLTFLDSHIRQGNALLGATPELMAAGIPDGAWKPTEADDRKVANALKKRNKQSAEGQRGLETLWSRSDGDGASTLSAAVAALEAQTDADVSGLTRKRTQWREILESESYRHQTLVADAWCAAFLWPKQPGALADAAPTNDLWRQLRDRQGEPPALTLTTVEELAREHSFFHWHLAFPRVMAHGGFDVVLGNPPWIAHAGRAAQRLPPGAKVFCECNFESFADYPTTHGMFVTVAARALREHGRLGLVIPSSLSELGGYAPTRRSHDRLCEFDGELVDFGEGQFVGVTQPCMALVSVRSRQGRRDAEIGEPWPMQRPDLTETDRKLLARLADPPKLPEELFGERGVQSDKALAKHFMQTPEPVDRFTTPIREGEDVREFELLSPRWHVDRQALGNRIRSAEQFEDVAVVIRQTARYPIAAVSDGVAFRNSLVAALHHRDWDPYALTAFLNSALVRWAHYKRFRDARQPVMPQLKIGHLRSIPTPNGGFGASLQQLAALGRRLSDPTWDDSEHARAELDALVFDLFDLSAEERHAVGAWHDNLGPVKPDNARSAKPRQSERLDAVAAHGGE